MKHWKKVGPKWCTVDGSGLGFQPHPLCRRAQCYCQNPPGTQGGTSQTLSCSPSLGRRCAADPDSFISHGRAGGVVVMGGWEYKLSGSTAHNGITQHNARVQGSSLLTQRRQPVRLTFPGFFAPPSPLLLRPVRSFFSTQVTLVRCYHISRLLPRSFAKHLALTKTPMALKNMENQLIKQTLNV